MYSNRFTTLPLTTMAKYADLREKMHNLQLCRLFIVYVKSKVSNYSR